MVRISNTEVGKCDLSGSFGFVLFFESMLLNIPLNISVPHLVLQFLGSGVAKQDEYLAALLGIQAGRLGLLLNTSAARYINALILLYVLGTRAYYANNCNPSSNY